jgi:hypothetical protein
MRAEQQRRERRTRYLFAGGTVALVVILIAVLVAVKLSSSNSGSGRSGPAPAAVLAADEHPSASAVDAVGLISQLGWPRALSGQPPLTSGGKPEVFYAGGEYCPYCAAERWAMVQALSRFGTFSNLGRTSSYSGDVYPGTPTFTFYGATYASSYLTFVPVEQYTNKLCGLSYCTLQKPTPAEERIIRKYDATPYQPTASNDGAIPFIDLANQYLVLGPQYSPAILHLDPTKTQPPDPAYTMQQIAQQISTPTSYISKGIVGSATLLTGALCELTHNQPGSVCDTKLIQQVEKALPAHALKVK